MNKEETLETLVELGKKGEEGAQAEILERFNPLLIKTTVKYFGVNQDFDDLLQEGRLVILAAIHSYDSSLGVPFPAYVQKQTFYYYINQRKKLVEDSILDQPMTENGASMKDILPSESLDIEGMITNVEDKKHLKEALLRLSPKQREVILEYYFNKKSLKSMAKEKDLCYQSLVKLKSRALKKLKDGLLLSDLSIY